MTKGKEMTEETKLDSMSPHELKKFIEDNFPDILEKEEIDLSIIQVDGKDVLLRESRKTVLIEKDDR